MKEFAIIFVGATPKQQEDWWPSYEMCNAGIDHDIIFVHRDWNGCPKSVTTKSGLKELHFENKILPDGEIPHKAFGAYRYYFLKYKDKYKNFAFISDDVKLRRDNWLLDVKNMFDKHEKLGFVSPMLSNNPSHIRAPIWFGKTECLEKIDWGFTDDHDGEMTIADRCVYAGYFGAQIGHKFDFAYDPFWHPTENPRVCGAPLPYQYMEKVKFGDSHFDTKFTRDEIDSLDEYHTMLFSNQVNEQLSHESIGPDLSVQRWNWCLEIQPYHGLIYNKGLQIAIDAGEELDIYDKETKSGPFDPDNEILFGISRGIYMCAGINKSNPIAILK